MAGWQPQVFIQVKDGDLVPCDERIGEQSIEHGELRRPGGEDEIGKALAFDGLTEYLGPLVGGLLAKGLNIRSDDGFHPDNYSVLAC